VNLKDDDASLLHFTSFSDLFFHHHQRETKIRNNVKPKKMDHMKLLLIGASEKKVKRRKETLLGHVCEAISPTHNDEAFFSLDDIIKKQACNTRITMY
jgi:hypothetical protein